MMSQRWRAPLLLWGAAVALPLQLRDGRQQRRVDGARQDCVGADAVTRKVDRWYRGSDEMETATTQQKMWRRSKEPEPRREGSGAPSLLVREISAAFETEYTIALRWLYSFSRRSSGNRALN